MASATPNGKSFAKVSPLLVASLLLLSAAISGCSTLNNIGAPSPEQKAKVVDSMLNAADFNVQRADPYNCHCLFTGDEAAYLRYAKIKEQAEWNEREKRDADAIVATRRQVDSCLQYNMSPLMGCVWF
jgi:hypothetical protein